MNVEFNCLFNTYILLLINQYVFSGTSTIDIWTMNIGTRNERKKYIPTFEIKIKELGEYTISTQ